MVEVIPIIEVSNLGMTVILVIKVAQIESIIKDYDGIEYQNPPLIQFFKGLSA